MNTTLGNIKTAIAGTYHHISAKHAQSYLTSFAYRFNRRFQLDSIVERVQTPYVGVRQLPLTLVEDADDHRSSSELGWACAGNPWAGGA